jgi:hypothetical protein
MQGINVFASSAARAAAITSPQEGQYSFLKDTNALEYYDGAAWVGAPVGDITAVTAGTGISGGGSSGDVTITNLMATAIDAKGDLVPGTGADTFARLAVGANGTVLTADSAEATGLKWAAAAGGGKVLQVIFGSTTTEVTNSTSTYSDTGCTVSITPSSASSRIMLIINHNGWNKSSADVGNFIETQLLRGATQVMFVSNGNRTSDQTLDLTVTQTLMYVDSPSTTSATTYKTQFRNGRNGAAVGINYGGSRSTIVALEIGA